MQKARESEGHPSSRKITDLAKAGGHVSQTAGPKEMDSVTERDRNIHAMKTPRLHCPLQEGP